MPVLESVFNNIAGPRTCNFITKKLQSCEICEIFKNPYFEEHLRTTASKFSLYFSSSFSISPLSLHQKQPFADILQNRCSQTFCRFYRKRLVLESLFHKVADLIPLDYNIIPCPLQLNVFFFLQTYIFPQSYSKLFAFYSQ